MIGSLIQTSRTCVWDVRVGDRVELNKAVLVERTPIRVMRVMRVMRL